MVSDSTATAASKGEPAASEPRIDVEVVYARQAAQTLMKVRGAPGLTAAEAIERSGILSARPEIDLGVNKIGIFGKPIKPDQALANGDRVEIYTPLIADPKQAKQKQAAKRNPKTENPDSDQAKPDGD